jgi:hypothetical protein
MRRLTRWRPTRLAGALEGQPRLAIAVGEIVRAMDLADTFEEALVLDDAL